MEPITASIIKRASYATLTQLCKQMGVEFLNQPKKQLTELLLSRLVQGESKSQASKELPESKQDKVISDSSKTKPVVIKKGAKKIIQTKPNPVKKGQKVKKASKPKEETKSSKILAMHLKGKSVFEISMALKAHPSFCYTVISNYKKGKKA
jgi:hypothetical protein